MDNLNCLSCGSSQFQAIYSNTEFGRKRDILRCKSCDLALVWPLPLNSELEKFYQDDYSLGYQSYSKKSLFSGFASKFSNSFLDIRIESRKKFLSQNKIEVRGKAVLEIGSANGKFLYHLKKMGAKVYGVEPSQKESKASKKNYDIYPVARNLEELLDKFSNHFDILFFFHVLEHLPDPLEDLKKIRTLLKKGGYLIGEVPFTPLDTAKLDEALLESMFNNLHLFHFRLEPIKNLFTKANYQILNLERIELKSTLSRINPNINAHYLHPSFERGLLIRFLSGLSALELVFKNKLLRLNVMDRLPDFSGKDWTGPNDWIRFLVKKSNHG